MTFILWWERGSIKVESDVFLVLNLEGYRRRFFWRSIHAYLCFNVQVGLSSSQHWCSYLCLSSVTNHVEWMSIRENRCDTIHLICVFLLSPHSRGLLSPQSVRSQIFRLEICLTLLWVSTGIVFSLIDTLKCTRRRSFSICKYSLEGRHRMYKLSVGYGVVLSTWPTILYMTNHLSTTGLGGSRWSKGTTWLGKRTWLKIDQWQD